MTITIKSFICSVCSLLLPGLGQFLYGKFAWALFWFICGLCTGGAANLVAALHVLMLEAK